MTGTIIEQSDGASYAVVTDQDGEQFVFNLIETESPEVLGQIEYESFCHSAVFKYSLLGDPNSEADEISDVYQCKDEYT